MRGYLIEVLLALAVTAMLILVASAADEVQRPKPAGTPPITRVPAAESAASSSSTGP